MLIKEPEASDRKARRGRMRSIMRAMVYANSMSETNSPRKTLMDVAHGPLRSLKRVLTIRAPNVTRNITEIGKIVIATALILQSCCSLKDGKGNDHGAQWIPPNNMLILNPMIMEYPVFWEFGA